MKPFSLLSVFVGASFVLAVSTAQAKPKSWVELSAQTSAEQYAVGVPIDIMLTAKNISSRTAHLQFSSGQRFDLQLFRKGASDPVYTWSADKMFAMTTGQLRLNPKQSQTFKAQIGEQQGPIGPGKYELRSHLTNSSRIEAEPVELEVVAAPVQVQASVDKTELKSGESLAVTITATNTSKTPQTLRFNSGQSFEVTVSNEKGDAVWNWSANKRFVQALRNISLAPGESQTFNATWDGNARPDSKITSGTYTVQAVVTSNPRISAAPVRVEVK